jgi:ribosomal protein L22
MKKRTNKQKAERAISMMLGYIEDGNIENIKEVRLLVSQILADEGIQAKFSEMKAKNFS